MTLLSHFEYRKESAAMNMAMDGLMLVYANESDAVLWRFYGWSEPAVTFGYSQKWDWVLSNSPDRAATHIRRWTGGGIVDHRKDLTYSLCIPASHGNHRSSALDVYEELHGLIVVVLKAFRIPGVLAPCPGKCSEPQAPATGICFVTPEPYDVMDPTTRTKLAGAAMKRNREGMLIQGSLNLPEAFKPDLSRFAECFGVHLAEWLKLPESRRADWPSSTELTKPTAQYASEQWNKKR